MAKLYMYVVDRDFGFAPNPFHGFCTLATCKADIRARASIGDWIVGMGGKRHEAVGLCIYAMQVTSTMTFDEYHEAPTCRVKRPVRNGSRKVMVGDNIYHRSADGIWQQADSHHSLADGSPNPANIEKDTKADRVLLSNHFIYFGSEAVVVPPALLERMGYANNHNYRVFKPPKSEILLTWLVGEFSSQFNQVRGDPFYFSRANGRYSSKTGRITYPE